MLFSKLFCGDRVKTPILDDLEAPVLPIGPDEGVVQRRDGGVLRVRTNLRAGGDAGEGTGQTDRSNTVQITSL